MIVVNRAFIEAELADGRLVQVMDRALQVADYLIGEVRRGR